MLRRRHRATELLDRREHHHAEHRQADGAEEQPGGKEQPAETLGQRRRQSPPLIAEVDADVRDGPAGPLPPVRSAEQLRKAVIPDESKAEAKPEEQQAGVPLPIEEAPHSSASARTDRRE